MRAFVTGGSGFMGRSLVRQLLARDHEVSVLVRSGADQARLAEMGANVVAGDMADIDAMRAGMAGSDVVFHLAGWRRIGSGDWIQAEAINVGGTRQVLRLAHQLGVPRIVYTSAVAVFGDTHGELVDESFYQEGPFLTEFDRTKWLAHHKVALPLIRNGAPIVIVMPGIAYGPGDDNLMGQAMRLFYRGFPLVPGPDTTYTFAHVDDIAEGHILAAEKGKIGESYILAGPAIPLGEMVDFWAHLLGRRPPPLRLPAAVIRPFGPLVESVGRLTPFPSLFNQETVNMLGATYAARADKARAELGWQTRPLQIGMLETFDWIEATEAARPERSGPARPLAVGALLALVVLLLLWLVGRSRRNNG